MKLEDLSSGASRLAATMLLNSDARASSIGNSSFSTGMIAVAENQSASAIASQITNRTMDCCLVPVLKRSKEAYSRTVSRHGGIDVRRGSHGCPQADGRRDCRTLLRHLDKKS